MSYGHEEAQIDAEIRILVAVLDGVELQWLPGADINLPDLVASHLDQAISRWKAAPATWATSRQPGARSSGVTPRRPALSL